eukprot:g14527.t1
MTATCYLAASRTFRAEFLDRSSPSAARVPLVGRAEGLTFDREMTGQSFDLNLTARSAGADETWPNITMLDDRDWTALMSNKTMYFHVLLEAESLEGRPDGQQGLWQLLGSVPLVKYGPPPKTRPTRRLLSDIGIGGGGGGGKVSGGARVGASNTGRAADGGGGGGGGSSAKSRRVGKYISFWKPEVAVRVVTDFTEYPHDYLPQTIQRSADIVGLTNDGRWADDHRWDHLAYKPIFHADEIGLTSDKYVPLSDTLSSLPLKITIEPMSLQRWQLMQSMEYSLQHQNEQFGLQDKDVDDFRRLISDTNLYLLIITLLASTLHLLFEGVPATAGDGSGTDANASLLPSDNGDGGAGDSSVRRRRRRKGAGAGSSPQGGGSVQEGGGGAEGSLGDQAVETMRYDRVAIAYLSLILLPLVLGYSVKKLVMDEHAGWYSWALQSLTAFVYTFGFVLMTPQLFINYKLKSVAHLPWRFLCYRSLNTVIDDLFAFVVRMPTMHRLSCFRDDVVFVVYLYQRWIYPVDANRPQDRGG